MRRRLGVLAALLVVACQQQTIQTPSRVLDRPSDVALTCVQFTPSAGDIFLPLPLDACEPVKIDAQSSHQGTPPVVDGAAYGPDGGEFVPELRALIVNSNRGELALVNLGLGTISDIDRRAPGFGFVPVGRQPEQVRASADGKKALTSNTASCDLGVVDLQSLYNVSFASLRDGGAEDLGVSQVDLVHRVTPTVGGRPLSVRPGWIEFGATPDRAWVALPGCQVIAEIDISATQPVGGIIPAEIQRAISLTPQGAKVIAATDPVLLACPVECAQAPAGAIADAGVPTDMGPPGGGLLPSDISFPSSFVFVTESGTAGRLIIGDAYGEKIAIFPFDSAVAGTAAFGPPRSLQLETGAIGVSKLRVSHRTAAGRFLYAIARDGGVRIVDLDREAECETNPDPRLLAELPLPAVNPLVPLPDEYVPEKTARRLGCFPIGDPATPRRSSLSLTPGFRARADALARDVAFVQQRIPPAPGAATGLFSPPASAGLLAGDFAWVVSSDGTATLLNIFDACPAPNRPADNLTPACALSSVRASVLSSVTNPGHPVPNEVDRTAHHARPVVSRFDIPINPQDTVGAPRINDPNNPIVTRVPSNTLAVAGMSTLPLPTLVGENDPLGAELRYHEFPDPDHVNNETWQISWEGLLFGRTTGKIRGNQLADNGAAFCALDVRAGDKVDLVGCDDDKNCGVEQTCVHDPSAQVAIGTGLCLDRNAVNAETTACAGILRAVRRYRITSAVQANTGESALTLAEIYEPEHPYETQTCTTDAECTKVNIVSADNRGGRIELPTTCMLDSDGAHRCLRSCVIPSEANPAPSDNEDRCGDGFICAPANTPDPEHGAVNRCMRAPLLSTELSNLCFRLEQTYRVRAGDSFTVVGSVSGMLTYTSPTPGTGECAVRSTTGNAAEYARLHQARIPIVPLNDCGVVVSALETIDRARFGTAPSQPNTCRIDRTYPNGITKTPQQVPPNELWIHYENPFFNMTVSLPRDAIIPPDEFTMQFVIVGGNGQFVVPLGLEGPAASPRTAIVAPDRETVFVVDEGEQPTATGLRGQLVRLNTSALSVDRGFIVR